MVYGRAGSAYYTAIGNFMKFMLFYFLLVATSLLPNPFQTGSGVSFFVYCLVALTYSGLLALFIAEPSQVCQPAESAVPVSNQVISRKLLADFSSGSALSIGQDFLIFFLSGCGLLGIIQFGHAFLGQMAPLPVTSLSVIGGVAAICLLAALLSNPALKSLTQSESI